MQLKTTQATNFQIYELINYRAINIHTDFQRSITANMQLTHIQYKFNDIYSQNKAKEKQIIEVTGRQDLAKAILQEIKL